MTWVVTNAHPAALRLIAGWQCRKGRIRLIASRRVVFRGTLIARQKRCNNLDHITHGTIRRRIGGGHNGLVRAIWPRRAQRAFPMVARDSGAPRSREEFSPDFATGHELYRQSAAPKSHRRSQIAPTGADVLRRPIANCRCPGRLSQDQPTLAATQHEVAKFSRRDADALPGYYTMLERCRRSA